MFRTKVFLQIALRSQGIFFLPMKIHWNEILNLEQINGLGKSKTEKYGIEIIEVLENA